MQMTKSEQNGGAITALEFAELMVEERSRQMKLYGFNPQFNLHRWAMIVMEEMGKMAKAANELTKAMETDQVSLAQQTSPYSKQQLISLQLKTRDQMLQIATCCLAVLQESPSMRLPKTDPAGCRCDICTGDTEAERDEAGERNKT